jgi:hypothetical protein
VGISRNKSTNTDNKRKKPASEPEVDKIYFEPTIDDVLLGRGSRPNLHKGNRRYLKEKEKIQPSYRAATREDKTGISQELVDAVNNWGRRFLKSDAEQNKWYEVLNSVARVKASQSLRDHNTPEDLASKRARYKQETKK